MLQNLSSNYGILAPAELDLLARVYEATLPIHASDGDCEEHAVSVLRLYTTSGIKVEQDLVAALKSRQKRAAGDASD